MQYFCSLHRQMLVNLTSTICDNNIMPVTVIGLTEHVRKNASWGSGISFMRTGHVRNASGEGGISFMRPGYFRNNASGEENQLYETWTLQAGRMLHQGRAHGGGVRGVLTPPPPPLSSRFFKNFRDF